MTKKEILLKPTRIIHSDAVTGLDDYSAKK